MNNNDERRQTNNLMRFVMPGFMMLLPALTFAFLMISFRDHREDITWAEMLLVPTGVFIVVSFIFSFFIAIWWYRHSIRFHQKGKH